jgi:hypothetical protein
MGYEHSIWGSMLGKSCIDMKTNMASWIGSRLVFLGENTTGVPIDDHGDDLFRDWPNNLQRHGHALNRYVRFRRDKRDISDTGYTNDRVDAAAQDAMDFVAKAFPHLWD